MKALTVAILALLSSCAGTQNSQTPAVKLEKATSQNWSGGAYGSGKGINYEIQLRYEGAKTLRLDTLWVGSRPFKLDQKQTENELYLVTARFTSKPYRNPDTGEVDFNQEIENPEKSGNPPTYEGAGLIVYRLDNERHTMTIKEFERLEALHYP